MPSPWDAPPKPAAAPAPALPAKPMESIDSIKIVQVDGLTQKGGAGSNGAGHGGGTGNLAQDAVAAALAYRAQAPVLDGLMKELGLDGSSLNGLVAGASGVVGEAALVTKANGSDEAAKLPAVSNDSGAAKDDDEEKVEAAE